MFWVNTLNIVMTSLLFGVIGTYFSLIAKFYRQKFNKGPSYRYLQSSLGVLILGLILHHPSLSMVPAYLPFALICIGGVTYTGLCYSLYRTMMSVG